jgi:ATPase family associated with various cellular activities (AAA)
VSATPVPKSDPRLPSWAQQLVSLYESNAANQYILYGNVNDQMLLPVDPICTGSLSDFLVRVLLNRFDVVLSYDVGNGIRVEKGGETFSGWPQLKQNPNLPKQPRPAVETLSHYFRYVANMRRLNRESTQVACVIRSADLLAPTVTGVADYDLSALAVLVRDWATDNALAEHTLATFLLTENINDMHPLIANNPRAAQLKLQLPTTTELQAVLKSWEPKSPTALQQYMGKSDQLAAELAGATVSSVEGMLRLHEHRGESIRPETVSKLKKELVEKECSGLIEFIESRRTLNDLYGLAKVKEWLRQDIQLWRANDVNALPKGYLLCGPVGTGKTYLVQCLAGEAGVPVVKLKNFRDKWVGSTEGNLEKIFRLLHALGRCYVFIDEADQAIGRRESGEGDSGLSGRVYSMLAEEMGNSDSRGNIIWVLASSRPDLIEIDLKRPGRVDVKIPLLPTTTPKEGFDLIRMLCGKRALQIDESLFASIEGRIPNLLTPGAAETLVTKIYRQVKTTNISAPEALTNTLSDYQHPVPLDVLSFQIRIAVAESTDMEFVPASLRAQKT